MSVADVEPEVSPGLLLLSLLENGEKGMPKEVAQYILEIGFTDAQRARMHDLIVRNQKDDLSTAERQELFAYGEAGTILASLKSTARRTLGVRRNMPTSA